MKPFLKQRSEIKEGDTEVFRKLIQKSSEKSDYF